MRELLLIAYHYPPLISTGTRRTSGFVTYLPETGYRPVVLTSQAHGRLQSDAAQLTFRADTLRSMLARAYRQLRLGQVADSPPRVAPDSRIMQLLQHVFIPDMHVTWYPLALQRGLQLIRSRPIKLIYSTSPCETAHLIARRLKQLSGLPWVADFRDGWMFDPPTPIKFSNPLRERIELALEGRVVAAANHIVTVNQTIASDFARRYPAARPRISVITNGYDPADFVGIGPKIAAGPSLRLVHTGSLSLSRAGTSLSGLLAALQALRTSAPSIFQTLQLEFIGQLTQAEQTLLSNAGLGDQLSLVGPVAYQQAIQAQLAADVLLLVTVPGVSSVATNKLFEYLASGRPILALTGQSAAAALIREFAAGLIVEPDDGAGIEQALRNLHTRWQSGALPTHIDERVKQFSRPRLSADLARIFDQTIAES